MHRGFLNSASLIAGALTAVTVATVAAVSPPAWAENNDISIRRTAERTTFSDDEIKDGFLKTAFRAELQIGRQDERIRKFDEPVRVFVASQGAPDRRNEIATIVADIRAHVNHLDVAITDNRQSANFVVTLVNRRDLETNDPRPLRCETSAANPTEAPPGMLVRYRQGSNLPHPPRRGDPAGR